MNAALQANLGAATLPGFLGPANDFLERQVIGFAAQALLGFALRESAELAAEIADIGIVDVAVHDIAHGVAIHLAPQLIRRLGNGFDLAVASMEQSNDLVLAQWISGHRPVEHPVKTGIGEKTRRDHKLGDLIVRRLGPARRPILGARQSIVIGRRKRRRAEPRIKPVFHVSHIRRIDREPLNQDLAH